MVQTKALKAAKKWGTVKNKVVSKAAKNFHAKGGKSQVWWTAHNKIEGLKNDLAHAHDGEGDTSFYDDLKDGASNLYNDLKDGGSNLVDKTFNTVDNVANKATGLFDNMIWPVAIVGGVVGIVFLTK
jgi:prophage DNA circulation protein